MKTRDLILGAATVMVAVGGAIASTSVNLVDAYARISVVGSDGFTCENTGLKCDIDGTQPCNVTVQRDTPPGTISVRARDINCNLYTNTTANSIGTWNPSNFNIDDVQ